MMLVIVIEAWGTALNSLISKSPPLNRDHDRDPNTRALQKRGSVNHEPTS